MVAEPVSDIWTQSFRIFVGEKGWPSNDQYTFFHVTRYDGPSRNRIWTNVNGAKAEGVNWLSLGGRSHKFYHNQWIQTGDDKIPPIGIGGRYLPTDPIEPDRLAGESVMEGRKSSKFRALFHGAGIGTKTRYSREQSDWACGSYPIRS
jgi:hypothetical protein